MGEARPIARPEGSGEGACIFVNYYCRYTTSTKFIFLKRVAAHPHGTPNSVSPLAKAGAHTVRHSDSCARRAGPRGRPPMKLHAPWCDDGGGGPATTTAQPAYECGRIQGCIRSNYPFSHAGPERAIQWLGADTDACAGATRRTQTARESAVSRCSLGPERGSRPSA